VALMEQRPFPMALSRVAATPHPSRISARGNEEELMTYTDLALLLNASAHLVQATATLVRALRRPP
jgi:hypothetical protein